MKTAIKSVLAGVGAGAALAVLYARVVRPWAARWGATEAETQIPLPGDEIAPGSRIDTTRAITINAPPERVWPWLVQIGQGRGGLYSYETLENLAGCDIHNVDEIIPELQVLKVGDQIRLGPEGYPFFTVEEIQPEKALVLRGGPPDGSQPNSWAFTLHPAGPGQTRLVVRSRNAYTPSPMNSILWGIVEPVAFLMEQKMLRGIKERAEGF